jgi:valyl-tRNA synthetase
VITKFAAEPVPAGDDQHGRVDVAARAATRGMSRAEAREQVVAELREM